MTKNDFILQFMIQRAAKYDASAAFAYQCDEEDRTDDIMKVQAKYFPGKVMEELSLATAVVECLDEDGYQEMPLFDDSDLL